MFYPMMINLKHKEVVIVGGGKVSYRKAKKLLEYGCNLKIIALNFVEEFEYIKEKIYFIKDEYKKEYIKDAFLVIAATSKKSINEEISKECKENNILCNIVDDINLSDFITSSTLKKGDLVISISTMGKSPSLAAKIKKDLECKYEGYEEIVEILGDIRDIVLKKCDNPKIKKQILNEIANLQLNELKKRRIEYENSSWI